MSSCLDAAGVMKFNDALFCHSADPPGHTVLILTLVQLSLVSQASFPMTILLFGFGLVGLTFSVTAKMENY